MTGTDDTLDELVATCLDELEERGPGALEAVVAAHPEHADELRARLAVLVDAGLLAEPDEPPGRLGPFRIGRRLGGGGMGVVYAAVQEPLEREVALKVVRGDQLFFPGARERFRREVQLVSRLAHASIVPVYTVGEHEGVPYFAMEHLRGATLAEVLAVLDAPLTDGAELAAAVARVVEARDGEVVEVGGALYIGDGTPCLLDIARRIAEALEHAHARGVLHRDVKPSNVMLTVDGRALLFDFGLASSAQASRLTRSGSRVGSLAYMPPEQARGAEVDERSDVYGVGALLCEALTLQAPHVGRPEAVSAALLSGEPVDLAARRPDLPRDVRTVIETALAADPADRYPRAADLARDLGNLWARRPIEARPAGPWLRGLRWVQRHPARAVALALVVLLPLALAGQQWLANRAVRAQFDRAEANLEHALQVLDHFVDELSHGVLTDLLRSDAHLLVILQEARDSLEQIIEQRPDDVHLRCRWIEVQATLGMAHVERGELEPASDCLRPALQVAERFEVDPSEQVSTLNALAMLVEREGQLETAEQLMRRAVEAHPEGPDLKSAVSSARLLTNHSRLLQAAGRREAAELTAREAIEAAERAVARADRHSDRAQAGEALAAAWLRSAVTLRGAGPPRPRRTVDDGPAGAAFRAAVRTALSLVEEFPERLSALTHAASVCVHANGIWTPAQAAELQERGLRWIGQVVERRPGWLDARCIAISLSSALASNLELLGRLEQASRLHDQAVRWADEALADAPADLRLLELAGEVEVIHAGCLVLLERRAEAIAPAQRAAARLQQVREVRGIVDPVEHALAWSVVHQGYGRLALGEFDAVRRLADGLELDVLQDPVLNVALGEVYAGCAEGLAGQAAAACAERALSLLERGVSMGFDRAAYLRGAREWDGLRASKRFEAVLGRLEG